MEGESEVVEGPRYDDNVVHVEQITHWDSSIAYTCYRRLAVIYFAGYELPLLYLYIKYRDIGKSGLVNILGDLKIGVCSALKYWHKHDFWF